MAIRSLLLILLSVLLSAAAQILFKLGSSLAARGGLVASDLNVAATVGALSNPPIVIGFLLYGCSAILWLFVLARVDVSTAYPFVGVGFIVTMFAGAALFGEPLTAAKVGGTLLICAGVVLLASRG